MNWTQIRTVLWLRWRLTRNQWHRGGKLNGALTMIAATLGIVVGASGLVLGLALGAFAFQEAQPVSLLLVWDGLVCAFTFLWAMGVLTELQRSEVIDLSRLLHLPVSLKGVFVVNYLASHVSLSIILFLPGMLGLAIGLGFGRGPAMLLVIPVLLSVIFMITAWTYCLRGWLISLMVNQRRRRTILVIVTVGFMALAQAPNLYFNVINPRPKHRETVTNPGPPPEFMAAHSYVPFLWPGQAAMALAKNNPLPAVWPTLAAFAVGLLGLRRAYTGTLRFYQGQASAKPVKPKPAVAKEQSSGPPPTTWLEKTLPGVSEETSTLVLAFLRCFSRAPELKMALGMNCFAMVMMAFIFLRGMKTVPDGPFRPLIATAAIGFQFLGLLQPMTNLFGFDRDGFRAMVLLPTRRKQFLLGKNLAFLPIGGAISLFFVSLLAVLLRLSPLDWLAAVCEFVFGFALFCGVGNLVSIYFPYRIGIGSLKPTKIPSKSKLMLFISHLSLPLLLIPLFIPPALGFAASQFAGWPGELVNLASALGLAAVGVCLYWFSLDGMGLLLQRREQEILRVVTTEVE